MPSYIAGISHNRDSEVPSPYEVCASRALLPPPLAPLTAPSRWQVKLDVICATNKSELARHNLHVPTAGRRAQLSQESLDEGGLCLVNWAQMPTGNLVRDTAPIVLLPPGRYPPDRDLDFLSSYQEVCQRFEQPPLERAPRARRARATSARCAHGNPALPPIAAARETTSRGWPPSGSRRCGA